MPDAPRLKSFDRVAHVYDQTRGMPPDAERAVADGIAAKLREVAPHPRLLEVGIGTGRIAVPLAERGVRVAGIDISRAMLAVLRSKRTDIDLAFAEAGQLPFRNASFDAALFVHILHLVPDSDATVRATLPLVRPGGLVILGGDDREESIRERANRVILQITQEVAGIDLGGWKPYESTHERALEILAEAGATIERRTLARWLSSTTAKRMAERLAARDFSSSWRIPDDKIDAIAAEARIRLAALFGGFEQSVEFERSFSIVAARLPG
jgi:ubiquinone/menaquinone biosynthesis C-methylase UbiE